MSCQNNFWSFHFVCAVDKILVHTCNKLNDEYFIERVYRINDLMRIVTNSSRSLNTLDKFAPGPGWEKYGFEEP